MNVKIRKFLVLFCVLIISTSLKAQKFDSIKNIEKFLTLTPKNLNSKLLEYGYTFKEKRKMTEMTTTSFVKQKSQLIVTYGFIEDKIVMFTWNDEIDKGIEIVQNIEDNTDYLINEKKTKEDFGLFYFQSKTTDLDIIIFRSIAQTQQGKIAFNLFRNKEKDLTELNSTVENNTVENEEKSESYGTAVSVVNAEYIGGREKMIDELSSSIDRKLVKKYKKEKSIKQFKVIVAFTVNEDGSINVNSIKDIDSIELKEEIKVAFENMPKWNPGGWWGDDGKLIPKKMTYNLPLTF